MNHISAMKARLAALLPAAALLLSAVPASAIGGPPSMEERPKLAIVVIDNLQPRSGFDRIDLAFQQVARQRKWPVTIATERIAANTQAHPLELRIFFLGIRESVPGEYTFRAWMTLVVRGVKHDLGIIGYRHFVRQWEDNNDMYDKIFLGAAKAAADKIEPRLFTRVPAQPASPSDAVPGK